MKSYPRLKSFLIILTITFLGWIVPGFVSAAPSSDPFGIWFQTTWAWISGLVIPIAVLMLIWSGFLLMTSGGDPNRVGLAKKYILGVVSGLGLLLLSYLFFNYVLGINTGYIYGIW